MTGVGHDAKFYYATNANIESTVPAPLWTLLEIVEDVTPSEELSVGEVKNRESADVKVVPALFSRQIECRITHSPGNLGYEAIRDAFHNGTDIAIAAMDGAIAAAGSEGLQMDAKVVSFQRSESLEDPMGYDVTFRPSHAAGTEPVWTEVA